MPLSPPKYILDVLARLEARGHSAYLVGGCVRDLLRGQRPNDWDVTTSAQPEDIMAVFPRTRPTGLQHGTVTVLTRGQSVEVTTYRADGEYHDHRRPDAVRFLPDVSGDLARRDFTVNAMALSRGGDLVDLFGGQTDLREKILRCVGDPDTRFSEDALRMLRAFRFSAQLGFGIEPATLASIRKNAALAQALARERVATELEKTLLSPAPEMVADMLEAGLLAGLCDGAGAARADFVCLQNTPKKRRERFGALTALLLQKAMLADGAAFLSGLRLDSATIKAASRGAHLAQSPPQDKTAWKRLLMENGEDAAVCCAAACDALCGPGHSRALIRVLKSGEPWRLSDLAVSGGELAGLGLRGAAIGQTQRALLAHVVERPADNEKEILLSLAQQPHNSNQIGAKPIGN